MFPGEKYECKPNPKNSANFLSKLTFFYAKNVLKKGGKSELQEEDIYEATSELKSGELCERLENEWNKEAKKSHPSFGKVMMRTYGKIYFFYGLLQLSFKVPFLIILPHVTSKFVAYFSSDQTEITKTMAIWYAVAYIVCQFTQALYTHNYTILVRTMGIQMRAAITSLIYKKVLRMSDKGLASVTSGRIMTIISKDVYSFDGAILFANDIWVGVVQVVLMTYLMYNKVGLSAVIAIGLYILVTPLQLWLGVKTTAVRIKTAKRTDQRLKLIQEVLSTIKIIKMYTWEKYFDKHTAYFRKLEMQLLKHIYYIKTVIFTMATTNARISICACFVVYIYLDNEINAEKVFYVLSCYQSLRHVLSVAVPICISQLAEAKSSCKRVKECLLTAEIKPKEFTTGEQCIRVNVNLAKVIQQKSSSPPVEISCSGSELIGITGPVGSGKSTLLKIILGDVSVPSASIETSGNISYAAQDPWLFPATIRQNILFGQPFDKQRYEKVLELSALSKDLSTFPEHDETVVTDKGLNLSKGQQARVCLARAIYADRDIYIFDGILASLDAEVSQYIFHKCIKEFLAGKLVILVTHNKKCLQHVDRVVVINRGTISSEPFELSDIDDVGDADVSNDSQVIPSVDPGEYDHVQSNEKGIEDDTFVPLLNKKIEAVRTTKIYGENHKHGDVDFAVYKSYLKHAGGWKLIPLCLFVFILAHVFFISFEFFIAKWADHEEKRNGSSSGVINGTDKFQFIEQIQNNAQYTFVFIIIGGAVCNCIASFSFFALSLRASRRIHRETFAKIISAHMSFFDSNMSGNILNRFSKDIGTIDEYMSSLFYECLRIFLVLIGVAALVGYSYYMLVIPTAVVGLLLYVCRNFYVRTGRSLNRLSGITMAPVLGHLNASIEGLTTIRVAGAQSILEKQFNDHLNKNLSTSFMYAMTNCAFGFGMDVISVIYISVIFAVYLSVDTGFSAGDVGLAITQVTGLTSLLQWGLIFWAELENHMTSLERVLEYTKVAQESRDGVEPEKWPGRGKIEYQSVTLKYAASQEILRNVSFCIEPGQKVGIVGRTGSGKSSLISVLFRLYDVSGSIFIDDVDTKTIEIESLRSRISIIPQDPVLFTGTLRANLDPFDKCTDLQIWKALSEVRLGANVEGLEMGLQTEIENGGSAWSVGERHLLCLARAILRNNNILILDEATANVDPATDDLIQSTIRRVFSNCTVVTIAHRLNTVMNSDKIMVIDGGQLVEFDRPSVLMTNKSGYFYKLTTDSSIKL